VRTESSIRGFSSILLAFALVLSMAVSITFTATPVAAGGTISTPGGTTITCYPGTTFTLQFKLFWNEPAYLGYFSLGIYWDSPKTDSTGTANENFTFVSASAYFEDNLQAISVNTTFSEGVSPDNPANWRYSIVVDHTIGDGGDDNFFVDIVLRASGAGGVPHIAPDNHTIVISGTVDVAEQSIVSYSPPDPNITIQVLPWTGGVIVRGKDGAYNLNGGGILPYVNYPAGSNMPIAVAQRVDTGAFLAGGLSSSCRNARWNDTVPNNPYKGLDDLLDAAFQWMVPGADNVLWYAKYVYNTSSLCTNLRDALIALGYDVDSSTDNLTPALLANYDILMLVQWQIENDKDPTENYPAGGDTDNAELLAWIPTIETWVRGGGGLAIMEGGDLGGRNYCRVSNMILDALDSDWWFQHDQVYDNVDNWGALWETTMDVITDNPIGLPTKRSQGGTTSACTAQAPWSTHR